MYILRFVGWGISGNFWMFILFFFRRVLVMITVVDELHNDLCYRETNLRQPALNHGHHKHI